MLNRISQRMKSCALPETDPVGDDLRSTDLSAVKLHISAQRYGRERRGNGP